MSEALIDIVAIALVIGVVWYLHRVNKEEMKFIEHKIRLVQRMQDRANIYEIEAMIHKEQAIIMRDEIAHYLNQEQEKQRETTEEEGASGLSST